MAGTVRVVNVAGVISPPGDKSVTHRALILAGLSRARVSIRRPLTANDARSTAKVLRQLGARVSPMGRGRRVERSRERLAGNEPVADLVVRPSRLIGVEVAADEMPSLIDEIPLLAVLASRAEGQTHFRSVGELRVKAGDRLSLIAKNLRAVGVTAEVQGEDLFVEGTEEPPRGRVETALDHRLAMAFAVLGTVPGAKVELSELGSAAVSYPNFQADLARAGNPCRVAS